MLSQDEKLDQEIKRGLLMTSYFWNSEPSIGE